MDKLFFYVAHCTWVILNIFRGSSNTERAVLPPSNKVAAMTADPMPLLDRISARITQITNLSPVVKFHAVLLALAAMSTLCD